MISQFIRLAALRARLELTRSPRRHAIETMAAQGRAPMSALFYHRVADSFPNDWTIGCKGFEQHVDYCRRNFDLISLSELQQRCIEITSHRPAVSFTFDDGYAENVEFAIPLLLQHRVPCTYFVSLQHILTGQAFDHDARIGKPLRVNTVQELRQMSAAGIEIGLHSRTHIDFDQVTCRTTLKREIVDAKVELENLIGQPIRYFAFPYGMPNQLTPQAIEMVHTAGMLGFCSAYGAYNLVGQDPFHIRRIHGDSDFVRLENWLTYDHRKVRCQSVIAYELPQQMAVHSAPFPSGLLDKPCFGAADHCQLGSTAIGMGADR